MKIRLFPDEYYSSAYAIDYKTKYDKGYRGIIFDIDNTLVPHGAPADDKAKELFLKLTNIGYKCCLLSNNKEKRVSDFNKEIGAYYICNASKPSRRGYENAMKIMGTDKSNTFFVGDQIFTDLLGAKNADLLMCLCKPIDWHEEIQIIFKRIPERIVMFFYFLTRHNKRK